MDGHPFFYIHRDQHGYQIFHVAESRVKKTQDDVTAEQPTGTLFPLSHLLPNSSHWEKTQAGNSKLWDMQSLHIIGNRKPS